MPSATSNGTQVTAFLNALGDLIGLTEPHLDEYDGEDYVTPSLIDHDDGKENDGRAAD